MDAANATSDPFAQTQQPMLSDRHLHQLVFLAPSKHLSVEVYHYPCDLSNTIICYLLFSDNHPDVVDAREAMYERVWQLANTTIVNGIQDPDRLARALLRVITSARRYATALMGTGQNHCPLCLYPSTICCDLCSMCDNSL